jgi:hypothetical protein
MTWVGVTATTVGRGEAVAVDAVCEEQAARVSRTKQGIKKATRNMQFPLHV